MALTRLSGPMAVTGGFTGPVTAAGVSVFPQGTARLAITVPAQATTDFSVTVPAGAILTGAQTFTTTAFGAVTDATIQIGTTVGGAELVAATTVKALGVYNHTLVAGAAATHANLPTTLRVRITQSGGNSAVGAATLVLTMSVPQT